VKEKSQKTMNNSMWRQACLLIALCLFVFSDVAITQNKTTKNKRIGIHKKQKAKLARQKQKSARKQSARKQTTRLQTPKTEEEFEGDAEKRQEWFMFQRMYPFNKIPDDARRRAWLSRPAEASFSVNAAPSWKSIGPKPTTSGFPNNWGVTSGRINAVAVSPANAQIVLIGGATGGVWRSTDGGTTFAPVSDNHVDLAVGSIAFAPSDANIVYAGMGDKASSYLGTGVLKSTNAGQTWTRISNNTLPSLGRISQILVDPTNPNRVYVAQYSLQQGNQNFASGFYYSTDGGVSWTNTLQGSPRDLVRHPTEPQTLFIAMQNAFPGNAGVYKSIDGGLTWNPIYTAPVAFPQNIKIAIAPSNGQIIYVLVGDNPRPRLEVTTNGGTNWTNLGSATFDVGQFGYNLYVFVHPTNPNTVYVGTRDVWRSTDGGMNFTNITKNFTLAGGYDPFISNAHPDQHHFYISPTDPNTIYIANDGGVWKSTDGAATFQTLNASLNLTMFVGLALHPTNPNISYGGTQDNGTQRRTGAISWHEFSPGDGGKAVIDRVDPSIVFSTYVEGSVTRWQNNGTVFDGQVGSGAIFNNDRVAFYPPFVGNGLNSNLYMGTYRLYVSTNRGDNWNAPGGATDLTNGGIDTLSAIGVGPANTNIIYTGSSQGRVMVSTDGGANWNQITTGLPNRFIKSIVVSKTNSNVAYLTVSGFDSGHVFKTTNAGATWTDISNNLPNIPVNTLLVDPQNANTLYVGTDIGIFRSQNDGGMWEGFNNGLPPVIITELDAQQTGLIQAASYGRGAYELTKGKNTQFDFDGDGKTDISIFRPPVGQWWIQKSSDNVTNAFAFGSATDKIVPGDYDGDGKTDVAFWRPSTSEWYVLRSSNLTFFAAPFGTTNDVPTPGDFDGDGKTDLAVFRPSNTTWFILRSSDNGVQAVPFGLATDIPVVGDYDGDGKSDVGIFRPTGGSGGGEWWILRSTAGLFATPFGAVNDKPVQGDYTGDGKTDVAFFRPSTAQWFVLRSEDLSFFAAPFGATTDTPVPGDYDGDGKNDLAVFRPSNVTWFILKSTGGTQIQTFGAVGDIPVPSAFVP
jgi:photosystem II stability/assembly factor-like uncharacterized protein